MLGSRHEDAVLFVFIVGDWFAVVGGEGFGIIHDHCKRVGALAKVWVQASFTSLRGRYSITCECGMGCAFAKFRLVDKGVGRPDEKISHRALVPRSKPSIQIDEAQVLGDFIDAERIKVKGKHTENVCCTAISESSRGRRRVPGQPEPKLRLRNPPKHLEGEQVAAGWPAWLSTAAGEAIKGWIPRRAASFEKLDKIGQGTYSNVYKARDLCSGNIVALKKVHFDNLEPESVKFMAREILVLRHLDHPNVLKLEGLVTSRMSCSLYLVFQYMEHDLAGLVASGIVFTEPQVKCYMHQLFLGLEHCHSRGVLHRDIKGANLLLDNKGILKIGDFGLATFFNCDQRQPMTAHVVTLWYRPPELLLGATEYCEAVDLWSTGCVLAELFAGKPIMPGHTEVEQLHKIFKLCGSPSEEYWKKSKLPHAVIFKPRLPYKRCMAEVFKHFPASSLLLLETLLAIEPADRGTAACALKSEFFTTKPYACEPSSLPIYPPSKEMDAKLRAREARRQKASGGRAHACNGTGQPGSLDQVATQYQAPKAKAEHKLSLHKHHLDSQLNVKSRWGKFPPPHEDAAIGLEPLQHGQSTLKLHDTPFVSSSYHHVPYKTSPLSGPLDKVKHSRWKKHNKEGIQIVPACSPVTNDN